MIFFFFVLVFKIISNIYYLFMGMFFSFVMFRMSFEFLIYKMINLIVKDCFFF